MSLIQILEKKNPDYKQELLWLDLKKNFNSIISKHNIQYDLDEQSDILNELQNSKLYDQINIIIIENIVQYSNYCIEFNDNYHKLLCYKHMKTLKKIFDKPIPQINTNYEILKLRK